MEVPIPPPIRVKRRIKRFDPVQLGLMSGVLYTIMGLIFVPFFLLATLASHNLPPEARAGAAGFGVGFALFMPIIYGAMGLIGGMIGALIYNLVAKWIGGIEVEVE